MPALFLITIFILESLHVQITSSVTFFCWNCGSDDDCCDSWAGLPYCCSSDRLSLLKQSGVAAEEYYCLTDDDCPTLSDRSRGNGDLDNCCQMTSKCCDSWQLHEDRLYTLAASFGGVVPFVLSVCLVAIIVCLAFMCICCKLICCRD